MTEKVPLGVDVPSIDRVVMLRPTESSVVFLQQLGRGLRASPGKTAVQVIDFVGNHRMFLERLRVLLSLGGDTGVERLRTLLEPELPDVAILAAHELAPGTAVTTAGRIEVG